MRTITTWLGSACVAAALGAALASPAGATTMKECSAQYKAAKADGSLAGADWKAFRKKMCSGSAAAATPKASETAAPAAVSKEGAVSKPAETAKAAAPAASAATGPATFPSAVDPKYAKEASGKARMHTCLDQYHANKSGSGNGGLRWIQKGGGYYSQCNAKLKG